MVLSSFLSSSADRLLGVIFCVIAFTGVISNAVMTVHLSTLSKHLRTRTTSMLIQISTADFLTCLTVAPVVAAGLLQDRYLPIEIGGDYDVNSPLANIIGLISTAMNSSSLLLIFVFSIDRFVAVFFPLQRTRILTAKSFTLLCSVAWILPITSSLYPIFKSGHYYYFPALGYYLAYLEIDTHLEQQLLYATSNLMVLAPFFLTIGISIATVVRLQRGSRKGKDTSLKRNMWWSGNRGTTGVSTCNRSGTTGVQSTCTTGVTTCTTSQTDKESSRRVNPLNLLSKQTQPDIVKSPDLRSSSQTLGTRESLTVLNSSKNSDCLVTKKRVKAPKSRQNKTNVVVLKIIGLYILCLLPGNLMNIYDMLDTLDALPASVSFEYLSQKDSVLTAYLYMCLIFSTLLYTVNSCINPYVYCFRSQYQRKIISEKFLSSFRNIFGRS
ncbi:uncharacterized protein LOC134813692 [Bolinopsis microptera]|uniref:uncharacterized protein LOC134813692 n=1 Tax=Bolinopsis microptera TaxID=2820187 RepID=UPI003079263A